MRASSCGRHTPTRSRSTCRSRARRGPQAVRGLARRAGRAGQRIRISRGRPGRRAQEHRRDQGIRPAGARRGIARREGAAQRRAEGRRSRRHAPADRPGLHEIGDDAADFGVAIRVEVHGSVTSELPHFAKIMEYADHPNVYTCWNSNPSDVKNGSIKENFALVAPKIHEVHLRDLTDEAYPWRELFALLKRKSTRDSPSPRFPKAPTRNACCGIFAACGWRISRGQPPERNCAADSVQCRCGSLLAAAIRSVERAVSISVPCLAISFFSQSASRRRLFTGLTQQVAASARNRRSSGSFGLFLSVQATARS